jgi:glycosyltransferase involved in cell wall biosynthesis
MPFVSFCFTTFKRPDILIETVKTILSQSFSDFEIVISDNDPECSGKKITEVLRDQRIKYFPNNENLGMKKSFNKSLERSTGEYIVMIADDDPVYPEMLQTLVDLEKKYPGHGLYMGGCNWFCMTAEMAKIYNLKVGANSCLANLDVNTVRVYNEDEFLMDFFNFKILPHYLWSTAMVKRSVLIEKGGVPDYQTAFLGDYAYLSIMASHSGCVVINNALGHQTIHNENFGRAQNEQIKLAVTNFISYVSERISHLKSWPNVEARMKHFVAVWAVSHMAFLYQYYKKYEPAELAKFAAIEKEVYALPVMKSYSLKYYLKKKHPVIHNYLVKLKNR